MTVNIKIKVFLDVVPHSLVNINVLEEQYHGSSSPALLGPWWPCIMVLWTLPLADLLAGHLLA
jgi:hypothetical protein